MRGRLLTRYSPIRRSARQQAAVLARLACIRHSTSVRSEPGSNSSLFYKVCPGTLSLSVNVIDRSITQAHLQILQRAPGLFGAGVPDFSTGTTPIIEIPREPSRGPGHFSRLSRFFFACNMNSLSNNRKNSLYAQDVHNLNSLFFIFFENFF